MISLRVYTSRVFFMILVLLILIFFLYYMLLTLPTAKDDDTSCSWCRTMGFESVRKDLNQQDEKVLDMLDIPLYVKEVDMIENGISVMYYDQFVLRGLTKLSSIRKSIDNIFFVESSCVGGSNSGDKQSEKFTLDATQACGVESTARANPDRPVYLLHSCPLADDFALRVPAYVRAILELHNVYVVPLDVTELSKGWPDPLPNSSTSLGLLALWHFGGTYCHLDTLILRSLRPLGTNYCGYREDDLLVGDVVLNFEPLGYGHTLVTRLLIDLSKSVQEGVWKEDDTYLTKLVVDQCSQLPESKQDCNKLTIYDSSVLFNVGLTDVQLFVENESFVEEFVDKVKRTAYSVNYFSRLYTSPEEELSRAFLTLAKEFCPSVHTRQ